MIDNRQRIEAYLTENNRWPTPDREFMFCQIIQRRKENPEQESNNRTIKSYYVRGPVDMEKKYPEIVTMCNLFNARAYINLNRLDYGKVALQTLSHIAKEIGNEQPWGALNAFDSVAGTAKTEPNRLWVLDIDYDTKNTEHNQHLLDIIVDYVRELVKETGREFSPLILPTRHGHHIISQPFNAQKFGETFPEIDIHKNNPTILYIP